MSHGYWGADLSQMMKGGVEVKMEMMKATALGNWVVKLIERHCLEEKLNWKKNILARSEC